MNLALFWTWWVAGLVLLVLELLAPGAFMLWLGLSALAVGTLLWLGAPLSYLQQVLVFSALSLSSVYAVRRFRGTQSLPPAETRLNERVRLYEGRIFTLETAILNGVGHLRVDDGQWRVAGPDLPPGSKVRVLAAEGATLTVEKCD